MVLKKAIEKVIEEDFAVEEAAAPMQLTTEQMKQALEVAKAQRQQACAQAIARALEEFGCELSAQVVLRQNQVKADVILLPKE
jgi:hypothetical protein